jgi:hypothetical protein
MKHLKIVPLVFALGFGATSLFIDTDPTVIKGKFTFVMIMVLISVVANMTDDFRKIYK